MANSYKDQWGQTWYMNDDGTQTASPKPSTPTPSIAPPSLGAITPTAIAPPAPLSFDPLLSPGSIYKQGQDAIAAAKAPLTDTVNGIVAPQIPLLTKQVNDQLNINRSNAQSDFLNRGITGSSTEVGTLTKDLPDAANKALAEGTVKLLTAAYPIAAAEKAQIVDSMFKSATLSTNLRSLIGDEWYKNADLNQKAEIANQDAQLKLKLTDVEMQFQAALKQAEFQFQSAENDKDRAVAQQQFEYLQSERQKARQGAFISSLTTLAGIGIAIGTGPAGASAAALAGRAAVGATAGQAAGGGFSNLFMLQ